MYQKQCHLLISPRISNAMRQYSVERSWPNVFWVGRRYCRDPPHYFLSQTGYHGSRHDEHHPSNVQQTPTQGYIRRYKGIITLAIHLPPEILASTFEECIKDGWTRTHLTVSHVCSSWRRAASLPPVWSHVYVNLDARYPYQRSRLWLNKSQGALLTIDIEIGNDTTHLPKTVNLLVKEMKRWKALSLNFCPFRARHQFCGRPAPELRLHSTWPRTSRYQSVSFGTIV